MRPAVGILVASLCLAMSLGGGCAAPQSEPASDIAQGRLPPIVRPLLTDRMYVHGEDLRDLNWAVLFLDLVTVQEIAERISEAPRFSPPGFADGAELNQRIPDDFFALQRALAQGARALSTAAASSDPVTVSAVYGRMVQICVRCHVRYLEESPARVSAEQKP